MDAIDFRGLIDVVAAVLADGRVDTADYPAVVAYVESLFDTYVAPFDIPGVGPLLEPYVDRALRGAIRPIVQALFDQLLPGPVPTPTPTPAPDTNPIL
jgi:predicted TPR repeat methyltransferase